MNSATTFTLRTASSAASLALGRELGRRLRGGELIELTGDLGGGKTVIVRGMAEGLGYKGQVTSPTFTISRIYELRRPDYVGGRSSDRAMRASELHHFDFYRVAEGDVVAAELAEVLGQPDVIVAVEWAANIGNVLPAERLTIELDVVDDTTRMVKLIARGERYTRIARELAEP